MAAPAALRRRWQELLPSGGTSRAGSPRAGASALGRNLAGGRRCLARALPLLATALVGGSLGHRTAPCGLVVGRPPGAWPSTVAPCDLATGTTYARRHQPCSQATALVGDCPCKGLWPWPATPFHA
ncbi:hypothetical protein BHE74_00028759 [Ensete ventricosum]|nr:hypothetical protein GW17_00004486 [Ensete ventricosum]RWW64026.1 hypothetical protein BHE74_00028759 [Ensete ventricosum]RZS13895.1 hypothetical protein BHM03_00045531 [Ensete ventricosum]